MPMANLPAAALVALALLLASALLPAPVAAAGGGRTLKVKINNIHDRPVTQTLPKGVPIASLDLPQDHPRIIKVAKGCEPEQVHLTYWGSSSVLVSWASCDAVLNSTQPARTSGVTSVVFYGSSPTALDKRAEGVATSYVADYTPLKRGINYASPVLHHVLLTGLTPGQNYHYQVASSIAGINTSKPPAGARTFSFQMPKPHTFPVKIGVIGDPGQTYNTSTTLERLIATKPQLVLHAGDFGYADRWMTADEYVKAALGVTYQPKWDTWARLFEPLLSGVPMVHTHGNHEMELMPNKELMTAYNARFPTPYLSGHNPNKGPSGFAPVRASADPFSNLYHSVELPGVMKLIMLTSYSPGQTFDKHEAQYVWLQQELAKTNRTQTPWLIVMLHAPFYNTYISHFKENECMRQAYEPLLVSHGVDLVIHGHTHAYERIKPVVDYKVSECGPQYLTVGDAGNVEGLTSDYVDTKSPAYCANPRSMPDKIFSPRYPPQQCYSFQDGRFCPTGQPEWSAYREAGFGFGTLDILSPTEARWTWIRNTAPAWQVADSVTLTRGPASSRC